MTHKDFQDLAALDAIGATTAGEKTTLQDHLAVCANCAAVAREYIETAGSIAMSIEPIQPPAAAWENIRAAISGTDGPKTRVITLKSEIAPSASGRVLLDIPGRRAVMAFSNLPPNAADQSYALWLIRADQSQPQPFGVFDVDQQGNGHLTVDHFPVEADLKAFAVTLEPRGGTASPTGAQYLVGGSS